ncbi:hypothetical protein [Stenomitos frigidus]|uniref:Uncharacterized protein n=1 Tax=Stenomitos frigidus ULC18 TaxID=2107698 RepID=A0A2T1E3G4_9CYAN|nr:hypothetical protein [Stenomitos frigidus]PSB27293.1 hypothetical protein C7B82_16740 [Stenomitos frigidus ULC18]
MNAQLVDSLVQVILALPAEEQAVLSKKLAEAQVSTTPLSQSNYGETGEQILQPLIAAGRIIPPAQHPEIPLLSEAGLKVMVSNIQISGKPLSEAAIEERGEW